MNVGVPAGQVAAPQLVPAVWIWQPAAPLHRPVLPQTLVEVGHVAASRGGLPAPMFVHVPVLQL